MSDTVLRAEKKYIIPLEYMVSQRGYFRAALEEDPHNGESGYPIRSLYFDTPVNRDFTEKEDGVELRRKIRLRVYSPSAKTAKLEMKQKQGADQQKRSLSVSREDAQRMAQGDYTPLFNYSEPFALECYGLMNTRAYRPAAIVEYRRTAFIAKENNIRVTFDSSIIATESSFDLFSENLPMYPVFKPHLAVLEVKYNGFLLSYIKTFLDNCGQSALSASKYCMARMIGCKYVQ